MPEDQRPDGWYRMAGWDWHGWKLVPAADAEAEILAGDGADLTHLTFGVAEPMSADEHRRCMEAIHYRFADNLPDGWTFTPYEATDQ